MESVINTNTASPKPSKGNKKIGLLILVAIVIMSMALMIVYIVQEKPQQTTTTTENVYNPIIPTASATNAVIGKVGDENIYQKDLDTELMNYPDVQGVDKRAVLLQKMSKDSIILQAAQKEGLVTLDASVYNSPQKDYAKRVSLVADVMNKIDERKNTIEGNIVTIWFFNGTAGAVGYERGREIANQKITALHTNVTGKKMTMQQAGDAIRADSSLASVDRSYKVNASRTFKGTSTDAITIDPNFDAVIRKLKPGEITPVFLAKSTDPDTKEVLDSLYMFAQVTKNSSGSSVTFDQWYAQQEKQYAINY